LKDIAMWKALPFCLAALIMATVAQAAEPWERWLLVKASDGAWGYNAKSIKAGTRPGTKSVRWAQYVLTPVKYEAGDWSFALSDTRFNCKAKTYTTFAMVMLDRDVKAIDVITPNTEHPLPKSGALAILHKIVCQKGGLKDARQVDSIETVFDELKALSR
jgi:hypothetical protein